MISSLSRSLGSGSTATWGRPSDWLALPTVQTSEQKFVGLFAVYDTDANYLALSATGNYTVDWGDGTSNNVSSGVTAEKQYTFSSIANSTLTTEGFKQVIVTVTPQGGNNLTNVNLQRKHSGNTNTGAFNVPWLDIVINSSALTSISIGGGIVTLGSLRQVTILSHALTTPTSLFFNCQALVSVPLFNATGITNANSMFNGCTSLIVAPALNLSSCTNTTSMFSGCTSLVNAPLINMSASTGAATMFNGCVNLVYVPALNFTNCSTNTNAFANCRSLSRALFTGLTRGISLANCNLSATAINEIFTNLGTASGAQTITVTGNRGAAACTPSIAVNKGFTVVV